MPRKLLLAGGIAALVLVVVGVVLVVSGIGRLGDTRLGETRTSVPGEREIRLSAHKYVVYYEVDEEDRALGVPGVSISIQGPDGSPLATDNYSADFNATSGGRHAQAISTVEPPRAGLYRLQVDGDSKEGDPAVVLGRPVTERLTPLIFGAIAIVIGLALALFVVLAALLGRRRARSTSGVGSASPGY